MIFLVCRGNFPDRLGTPYLVGEKCSGCPGHCKKIAQKKKTQKQLIKKVCTNSCPVADLWINCKDLVEKWPEWMCNAKNSTEGRQRFKNCKAACTCEGRIKN